MSDVIGRGVIEASVDAKGVKAGIEEAKRSIRSLGGATSDVTRRASDSIDRYVKRLELQAATMGKTARESEQYKLSLRGASKEQLAAADSALRMIEGYERSVALSGRVRSAVLGLAAAAGTGLVAAAVAFDQLIKKAGEFQDIAEKTGDTAVNIASLAVAAGAGGISMEVIADASARLTKNLTGLDDESKDAGAAIAALGLDLKTFKDLKFADQLEAVGRALNGFQDGAEKTAVALALFGKSGAQLLPFLKELGGETGRQNILSEEQIRLADEYSDKQAVLRAQISLYAQAIATEALPALNDFSATIAQLARDQDFAATASSLLKGALAGAVVVFQTIAVVASDVGFVFKGIGREIGAIAAQAAALARRDFNGFSAISDAVRQDAAAARAELDRFQAAVMAIGSSGAVGGASKTSGDFTRLDRTPARPRLRYSGAANKPAQTRADSTLAQEAKAQLAYDLDQIRKDSEAQINTYANAENIIQALRAAALVDEGEYFASKLALLRLNAQAQDEALRQQVERIKAESLIGKDRIDADRKILDLQAQRAKLGENASVNAEILSIQERTSLAKKTQAYQDATIAAREYLDAIAKRNEREIEGIGRGERFRQRQEGLNDLEDKFLKDRQRLERDRRNKQITEQEYAQYLQVARETYAAEVALYRQRVVAMDAEQADWLNGFSESLSNYLDQSRDVAGQTKQIFDNIFEGLEDAITRFVTKGQFDFKTLANSIAADITRISVRSVLGQGLEALGGGDLFGSILKNVGKSVVSGGPERLNGGAAVAAQTAAVSANTVALSTATASMTALSAAEVAASSAIATASASSAAALASLGASATAAATALAAIAASSASGRDGIASALSLISGAADPVSVPPSGAGMTYLFGAKQGGYTGDSGVNEIAGFVHGKEYVLSAPAVRTIGVEALDLMHRKAIAGNRAIGGPVSPGRLYEVNERGQPELLEVAGRQYLMVGQQGASVKVPESPADRAATYVTVQVTPPANASRETAQQWGAAAGRHLQHAMRRNG